jgi:hypothetical protein
MREDCKEEPLLIRNLFPREKYTYGFTNCTLLTAASQKVGLMFGLYHCLATKRVSDLYQKSILRQQQKYLSLTCFQVDQPGESSASLSSSAPAIPSLVGDEYYFKK